MQRSNSAPIKQRRLRVLDVEPIVTTFEGAETVHVRCAPGVAKKGESFQLIALDVAAIERHHLDPVLVASSKKESSAFLCCERVVLQSSGWQGASVQVKPVMGLQQQQVRVLVALVHMVPDLGMSWNPVCSWRVLDTVTVTFEYYDAWSIDPHIRVVLGSLCCLCSMLDAIGQLNETDQLGMRAQGGWSAAIRSIVDQCVPQDLAQSLVSELGAGDALEVPVGRMLDGSRACFPHELGGCSQVVAFGSGAGEIVPLDQVARTISGFPVVFLHEFDLGSAIVAAAKRGGPPRGLVVLQHRIGELVAAMREVAHSMDTKVVRKGWFQSGNVVVGQVDSSDPHKFYVPQGHGLRPTDDIIVGGEFNRVRELGSIIASYKLPSVYSDLDLVRIISIPVCPASSASSGKTLEFILNVEVFDASAEGQALTELMNKFNTKLPEEAIKRQAALVNLYTGQSIYGAMNKAMYENDPDGLKRFAPYIRALRDVFLVGRPDPLVQPFSGKVTRRMNLDSDRVRSEYLKGNFVCWSAFSSASESCAGGKDFFGGVLFKLDAREPKSGTYAPASIKEWSHFQAENEVLVPPHCMFRVVNVMLDPEVEVHLELFRADMPLIWDMIQDRQWERVVQWVDLNPELVDTRNFKHSLICAVGAAANSLDVVRVLDSCMERKANVNEVDKQSGCTVLAEIARSGTEYSEMLVLLHHLVDAGAHPHLKGPGGQSLADILPGAIPDIAALQSATPRWWHFVDDRVDGKTSGWHPYSDEGTDNMEVHYMPWACDSDHLNCLKVCVVHSGSFAYRVSFADMMQANETTGTKRHIRRTCTHMTELGPNCDACGSEWSHQDDGMRCSAGCGRFIPAKNIFHGGENSVKAGC